MISGAAVGRIYILVSDRIGYFADVMHGVRTYSKRHPDLTFRQGWPLYHGWNEIYGWKPDGIIIDLRDDAWHAEVLRRGVPAVNVGMTRHGESIPRVGIDERTTGTLGARHLIDCGLRHFAFYGVPGIEFSAERQASFSETVRLAGYACEAFDPDDVKHVGPAHEDNVKRWLQRLPRPVGVMTFHDNFGMQLAELCREVGLRVPDDVAIVGVDDNDLLCDLSHPPLSSVMVPGERIGYEATALLMSILHGQTLPPLPILLPSPGVAARASSDIVAVDDADVASAIRFVRRCFREAISIDDIADHVGTPRRTLERRFRQHVGRSLLDELRRVRVDSACKMLAETEAPVHEVAIKSGFANTERLAVVFKQLMHQTPGDYRQQHKSR